MFFLLRSAFCITAVVVALSERPGGLPDHGTLAAATERVGALASSAALRLCRTVPDRCAKVAANGILDVSTGIEPLGKAAWRAGPTSRDTLLADDLRPRWIGPLKMARN